MAELRHRKIIRFTQKVPNIGFLHGVLNLGAYVFTSASYVSSRAPAAAAGEERKREEERQADMDAIESLRRTKGEGTNDTRGEDAKEGEECREG